MSKSDPTPLNGCGSSATQNDKLTAGKTTLTGQNGGAGVAAAFDGPDLSRDDDADGRPPASDERDGERMTDDDPAELERIARGEAPVSGGGAKDGDRA